MQAAPQKRKKIINWKLCEKYGLHKQWELVRTDPTPVAEDEWEKLFWYVNIRCDQIIETWTIYFLVYPYLETYLSTRRKKEKRKK